MTPRCHTSLKPRLHDLSLACVMSEDWLWNATPQGIHLKYDLECHEDHLSCGALTPCEFAQHTPWIPGKHCNVCPILALPLGELSIKTRGM